MNRRQLLLTTLSAGIAAQSRVFAQASPAGAKMRHSVCRATFGKVPLDEFCETCKGLGIESIVICSGEFCRTPFAQGTDGRDHNPYGFSLWAAGGGFKGGLTYGSTDDFGYHAIENKVSIYDFWATEQHQLGIDHEQLTYFFGGRHFRLSDIEGHFIKELVV